MKSNYTHASILLDRSGSMDSIKNDVIGGFNNFIEEQKRVPGEMSVSLLSFATHGDSKVDYDFVTLDRVWPLTLDTYHPSGQTALNDSLVRLINITGKQLADLPEQDRPEKVVVVIITDGEENDSREHSIDAVKKIIEHQREKYNWQFVYIGANQDAFAEAQKRGINIAAKYKDRKIAVAFKNLSASNTIYRGAGVGQSFAFVEEEDQN